MLSENIAFILKKDNIKLSKDINIFIFGKDKYIESCMLL